MVRTGAHPLRYLSNDSGGLFLLVLEWLSGYACASPLVHLCLTLFGPVLFYLALLGLTLFGYGALAELDGPLRLG